MSFFLKESLKSWHPLANRRFDTDLSQRRFAPLFWGGQAKRYPLLTHQKRLRMAPIFKRRPKW